MNAITISIIKGGAGKSTTAAALAQAAAHGGSRVLCIDLDPQANLSNFLGADCKRPGTLELLHGATPKDTIQTTPTAGIDALTANPALSAETTRAGSAWRLKEALALVSSLYDWAVIDTPPSIGEITYNGLLAADYLLIPMEADINNLQGLVQLVGILKELRADPQRGAILTRYDPRPRLNRDLKEAIKEKAEATGVPLLGSIRQGIAVREAQAYRVSLYEYAPHSKPAEDYMELFGAIRERMKKGNG